MGALNAFNIPDWPTVVESCGSYDSYKRLVDERLNAYGHDKFVRVAANHIAQVPYTQFQCAPSQLLSSIRSLGLPWSALLCVRGWCRLRAGLACLRALSGRRSNAKFQRCIFCVRRVRNATVHAVCVCQRWASLRKAFQESAGILADCTTHAFCLEVLGCSPSSPGFIDAIQLADAIDMAASDYWKMV